MKIEKVESLLSGNSHFVRIVTDNGIEGIGQSACWGYMEATDAVISSFKDYLIGQDPLKTEHHWQYLYRMGPFRGSILSAAISAVDIALWDIKGKFYEAPVWQLLGGKVRDKIKIYTHLGMGDMNAVYRDTMEKNKLNEHASALLEKGYKAFKVVFIPFTHHTNSLKNLLLLSITHWVKP